MPTLRGARRARRTRRLFWTLCCVICTGSSSPVLAGLIQEKEPNNSISEAQNIDGHFTLDFDENIGDESPDGMKRINTSTTIPHVTIEGTGNGTFDFYSFVVANAGDRGIFDIDFGFGSGGDIDTQLFLFDSGGDIPPGTSSTNLASSDDSDVADGANGSTSASDSFFTHTFQNPGTYVIGVGEFFSERSNGGLSGNTPDTDDTYTLQVSIENHSTAAIPEPGVTTLMGAGVAFTLFYGWRRSRRCKLKVRRSKAILK